MPSKWTDKEDRDLLFAILTTKLGEGRMDLDWDQISNLMTEWGYTFTSSAVSQRFSKKIYKDFKESKGNSNNGTGTPSKASAKKRKAADSTEGADNIDIETPIKKSKVPAKKKAFARREHGSEAEEDLDGDI